MLRRTAASFRFAVLGSLLVSWPLTGCGDDDDDDGSTYEASCDTACSRAHECNSTVDVQTCAADCRNDYAAIGPLVNARYLSGLDACIRELNCPELALSGILNPCDDEARANVSPSNAVTTYCDEVAASWMECLGVSSNTAECVENTKIFTDSAVNSARECLQKSCNERIPCIAAALAIDSTGTE